MDLDLVHWSKCFVFNQGIGAMLLKTQNWDTPGDVGLIVLHRLVVAHKNSTET